MTDFWKNYKFGKFISTFLTRKCKFIQRVSCFFDQTIFDFHYCGKLLDVSEKCPIEILEHVYMRKVVRGHEICGLFYSS